MNNMELVSVIIPTYNRIHEIAASIDSVLSQDYTELEVIVVDDGSTDDTERFVREKFGEKIRFLKLEGNHGCHYARNEGIKIARGDIIAFNDSDDRWHRDKLRKQMDYWADRPDDLLIYAAYETTRLGRTIRVPNVQPLERLQGQIFTELLCRNTIGSPTILVRKDAFYQAGGFDDGFPALEDWEFVLRLSQLGSIGFVDEVLVDVDATEGGISSSTSNYYVARCKMVAKYYDLIREYGLFDRIVTDIFERAENSGLLPQVKQILIYELQSAGCSI